MKFNQLKSLHFVGIAGSGMSPLAELSFYAGIKVSGSDAAVSDEFNRLKGLGINVSQEHNPESIEEVDAIVISSAIKKDNPILLKAVQNNIKVLHRSELLSLIMNNFQTIAIAGTHGKTTTTAMISHMLFHLGLDPSFAIGGKLINLNSSCRLGKGPHFVAEADESDGTFLRYSPYIGIITNIANDHMDFYKTEESIDEHFIKFGKNVKKEGFLIVGWEEQRTQNLKEHFPNRITSFGFNIGCDVRCYEWKSQKGITQFKAVVEKEKIECTIPLPGKHNILNALCALAVAKSLGINIHQAAQALASFPGVKRRFEVLHKDEYTMIVDDYAHNPDKIKSCIDGLKDSWPHHKLVVCFQPHRYTRLSTLYNDFLKSFSSADRVIVTPIYSAGEQVIPGYNEVLTAKGICESSNTSAIATQSLENAVQAMLNEKDVYTIFLTVGAGDISKVSNDLKKHF